jgi:hypothetical protein
VYSFFKNRSMSGIRGGISERNVTGIWLKVRSKRVGSILGFKTRCSGSKNQCIYTLHHCGNGKNVLNFTVCICEAVIAASQSYLSNSLPSMH